MRFAVMLLWKEGQQEHREHTFTAEISRFGCALYSHARFEPKTPIQVQFEGKVMDARTVYSLHDRSTNLVEIGVDFGRDCCDFWGVPLQNG